MLTTEQVRCIRQVAVAVVRLRVVRLAILLLVLAQQVQPLAEAVQQIVAVAVVEVPPVLAEQVALVVSSFVI